MFEKMKRLFKILCLVLVIVAIGIVILLIDTSLIHQEFGVMVELYEAKDCSQTNSNGCLIYGSSISNNLFKRRSLEEALYRILNTPPESVTVKTLSKISSKNTSDWDCSLNGKVIKNEKEQKVWSPKQIVYKCWPNKLSL
jgi:hypothetical protein